jgi:hypothetical protein
MIMRKKWEELVFGSLIMKKELLISLKVVIVGKIIK